MLPNLLGGKLLTGVLPLNAQDNAESWVLPSQSPIIDIESCIDNPTLAPLGDHIRHLGEKPKRHGKDPEGQVKIQQRRDIQQKDIHGSGLLMLRRKNLTTDQLAQHLNAKAPPLASFLNQQQLLLQHNHWFDSLVELNISRNKLTSLPTEIASLSHLRTLNASSNLLTQLPPELHSLTHLQVLNLSQNQLTMISDELPLQLPYLITLSVAGNAIDYLTPNVNRWMHLRHLQLGSVFGGNRLTRLPDTIGDMPCLEELELSFNRLCTLPTMMAIPTLINLNVSRNQLDSLPASIGECHALKTLNVSKNHLTSLPATLVNLDHLELLDISENLLCIMPADILDRMKTTLLITGNPLTRPGHCNASHASDNAYAQVLKRMAMRALPMVSASSLGSGSASSSNRPSQSQEKGCLSLSTSSLAPLPTHQSSHDPEPFTSTSTPMTPSLYHVDNTDDDSMIDRELSILAQQLNVQGASKDRQSSTTPLSEGTSITSSDDNNSPTTSPSTTPSSSITTTTTTQDDLFSRSLLMEAVEAALDDETIPCSVMDSNTSSPTTTTTTNMLLSLRELATRVILQSDHHLKVPLELLPPHLAHDISSRHRRRWCAKCHQPFVNEWLTSVQVKSYGGHPAVVHRVRFCSTRCWQLYLHSRKSSVVCVHRPDTQPILQNDDETDWLDSPSYSLIDPAVET